MARNSQCRASCKSWATSHRCLDSLACHWHAPLPKLPLSYRQRSSACSCRTLPGPGESLSLIACQGNDSQICAVIASKKALYCRHHDLVIAWWRLDWQCHVASFHVHWWWPPDDSDCSAAMVSVLLSLLYRLSQKKLSFRAALYRQQRWCLTRQEAVHSPHVCLCVGHVLASLIFFLCQNEKSLVSSETEADFVACTAILWIVQLACSVEGTPRLAMRIAPSPLASISSISALKIGSIEHGH